MSETFKTEMMIHEHFKNCRTADIDQHDFAAWLAQHDAEAAKAERERIIALLQSHIYSQTDYVCSCQIDDDYPDTMSVDEWVEHICTYQGERTNE